MSEPQLAPAPADTEQAARVLSALAKAGYRRSCSIEMRVPEALPLDTLEQCVARLTAAARSAQGDEGA
jgi:hypothetical protein